MMNNYDTDMDDIKDMPIDPLLDIEEIVVVATNENDFDETINFQYHEEVQISSIQQEECNGENVFESACNYINKEIHHHVEPVSLPCQILSHNTENPFNVGIYFHPKNVTSKIRTKKLYDKTCKRHEFVSICEYDLDDVKALCYKMLEEYNVLFEDPMKEDAAKPLDIITIYIEDFVIETIFPRNGRNIELDYSRIKQTPVLLEIINHISTLSNRYSDATREFKDKYRRSRKSSAISTAISNTQSNPVDIILTAIYFCETVEQSIQFHNILDSAYENEDHLVFQNNLFQSPVKPDNQSSSFFSLTRSIANDPGNHVESLIRSQSIGRLQERKRNEQRIKESLDREFKSLDEKVFRILEDNKIRVTKLKEKEQLLKVHAPAIERSFFNEKLKNRFIDTTFFLLVAMGSCCMYAVYYSELLWNDIRQCNTIIDAFKTIGIQLMQKYCQILCRDREVESINVTVPHTYDDFQNFASNIYNSFLPKESTPQSSFSSWSLYQYASQSIPYSLSVVMRNLIFTLMSLDEQDFKCIMKLFYILFPYFVTSSIINYFGSWISIIKYAGDAILYVSLVNYFSNSIVEFLGPMWPLSFLLLFQYFIFYVVENFYGGLTFVRSNYLLYISYVAGILIVSRYLAQGVEPFLEFDVLHQCIDFIFTTINNLTL